MTDDKKKVTLVLDGAALVALREIQLWTGFSVVDTLRDALGVYTWIARTLREDPDVRWG
jgi:hypothetical protein